MRLLILALALAIPADPPIVLHTLGGGRVEPVLAVSLTLQRVDGKPVVLPASYVQCQAHGQILRCDGVDYSIAGVTFTTK